MTRFLWWMSVPVMISRRNLHHSPPGQPARTPWSFDSGGFTELSMHGRWTITAQDYVQEARRYINTLGSPDFIAPQDWMCEEPILRKTGLSIRLHQQFTVNNYLALRNIAPELPWMPVLQGWSRDDYLRCLALYNSLGVDLQQEERVGIGTVCRRQKTTEAADIVRTLAAEGLRLHGFGIKRQGLQRISSQLISADSHAWSYWPRYSTRAPDCCGHYAYCSNCWHYAQRWHGDVLASLSPAPKE